MATKNDLNYVAYQVIDVLQEQGFDDFYINEKIERLSDFNSNKASTLLWASNYLDKANFKLLLDKLNLTEDHVSVFCLVMNKL